MDIQHDLIISNEQAGYEYAGEKLFNDKNAYKRMRGLTSVINRIIISDIEIEAFKNGNQIATIICGQILLIGKEY